MQANFSNTPIFNESEAKHKLILERMALMKSELPVKALLNYWSDTTGECHCFPVFKTDMPMDVINRYCDTFPREYQDLINEVKTMNENLHNSNAMSKEKTNMAKLRIPILVYRALVELNENFWQGQKGIRWLENNIKPLKIGKT